MIPDEVIEQVRDSADLVSLIGETVELRRTGADYRGPCPFHGGVHRNFAVIPRKGRYYCFVCKESGDVFSWLMKRSGLDYPGAVREVARRSGIAIPEQPSRAGPDPREPLFSAMSVAHDWFARQLREAPDAAEARQYLVSRGLDLETVGPFELGFAPRSPRFQPAMAELGLDPGVMLEAGLLARRDNGSIIPRFRGRLLFPIHDLRGRVVGFGGRLLGPGEPKYLNSPESPIFRKGGTLYNLHQAKNAIRKEEQVILVEGYFDVLRLVLAGAEQVVAPLGTALTPDQAALLRRFTEHAILLLDSDTAGLKATFRAGDELLRHGVRVRVATMPAGEDPDTLVRRGGLAALEPILRDAVDVMERKLQILDRKGWFADIEHRREALDRLLPTIRATRDPIQRELYLTLVAERTGVDKKVLEREAAEEPRRPEPAPNAPARAEGPGGPPTAEPSGEGSRAERSLLTLMLLNADWRERGRESVVPAWFEQPDHRAVYEALLGMDQAGVAAPPETLPDPVRLRWARLLEGVPQLQARDGAGQAALFDGACRILEIRPQFRALDALNDELQLAPEENRAELLGRREALRRDLRARYPVEYQARYGHHRQRRNVMQRHRRPQA